MMASLHKQDMQRRDTEENLDQLYLGEFPNSALVQSKIAADTLVPTANNTSELVS